MTTFNEYRLRESSMRALDAMIITTPAPIQAEAIPPLLEGRDLIGQACTGSGKTLAFALPLVEKVDERKGDTQAIVLVPTRELAQQVGGVVTQLAAGTGVRVAMLFGGQAIGPQRDRLKLGAQVVVGTPGRILDHIAQRTLRLDRIRFLVLDEADEMLDRGFAPDVERIVSTMPVERQTALFSATTPEWVQKVASRYLKDPLKIEMDSGVEDGPDIEHEVYEVWKEDKISVLRRLLDEEIDGATLIFGRTKHGVRNLGEKLLRMGYQVGVIQGNLSQGQRDQVISRFRKGTTRILVATNVAARGLDVSHIERVINYELPETHELFTHRVGRTGRMGRAGRAITLLGPADLAKWHEIEKGLGRKMPRFSSTGEAVLEPEKPVATVTAGSRHRFSRRRFSR